MGTLLRRRVSALRGIAPARARTRHGSALQSLICRGLKNRHRSLNREIARSFFRRVVDRAKDLMSDEHFTIDGTLIEAWASQKSFQKEDGDTDGDGRDFRGESRTNDTHASTTDPEARLYRRLHKSRRQRRGSTVRLVDAFS
jgi:hypothetical protein